MEKISPVRSAAARRAPRDAPLDEIARRAGVGNATLYRRFPERQSLVRAVVLDVLRRVGHEARLALAEEPDAFGALARYMHRALAPGRKPFVPMNGHSVERWLVQADG